MSIIIISRRPFSRGQEVARQVAHRLGYRCIAREVLFEAASDLGTDDSRVLRAIHDAPSFSDHFHYGRERYVAFFEAALLELLRSDDIVYHGLAGHFFVQRVPHVLKVRVITGLAERVHALRERENIGVREAERIINREDRDRRKWSRHLYGVDTWDPGLYDLTLNIECLSTEEAVEIICRTQALDRYRTTPESQRRLDDLALGARVRAALMEIRPDIEGRAEDGRVLVTAKAREAEERQLCQQIEGIVRAIPGVEEVEIHVDHAVRHFD
jgi:cytidylate kinase